MLLKKIFRGGDTSHSEDRERRAEAAAAAQHMQLSDFTLARTLGTGSFGRVFMAKHRDDPKSNPVAIKRLKKAVVIRQRQVDHIVSEKKRFWRQLDIHS